MRPHHGLALAFITLTIPTGCFEDVGNGMTAGQSDSTGDGDGDGDAGDGDGDPSGDGDPTGDGDGDGDGDDPTGSEDCQASEICVEEPLAGWQGPLALYSGAIDQIPPACQGTLPVKVAELFGDLQTNETDETCTCACSGLQGASCAPVSLVKSSTNLCLNLVNSWPIAENECKNLGGVQASGRYSASAPNLTSGSCTPQLVEDVPAAEFSTRVLACAVADSAQQCGTDGVCMVPPEDPFDAAICIATEGEVQCPSGPYSNRFVYHTNLQDDRSCGNCSCELPPNSKCDGAVHLLQNGCALNGLLLGIVEFGSCSASIANVEYGRFVPAQVQSASCDAVGGQIQGKVEEVGAWTFCCQ